MDHERRGRYPFPLIIPRQPPGEAPPTCGADVAGQARTFVSVAGFADGIYRCEPGGSTWVAIASLGHTHAAPSLTLDDLTDVSVASPTTGDTVRWDGTNWVKGPRLLTNTKTYDPPSVASNARTNTTLTVTGAAVGDLVSCKHTTVITQDWDEDYRVSAADTVLYVLTNRTAGAIDLGSGTLRCVVEKWP